MTASSFAVMGVQLGYAAITSRLLPPSAFGAYAVALSGVGFIGMLGGSSLGTAAARRDHDSVQLDRSLVTLALIVGFPTALLAMLLAPLWGRVWGVPESTQITRVLALGIPLSALTAVMAGILRRGGRTSAVAGRTGLGQLVGIAVGLAAILSLRTTWSLAVVSVAGLVVTASLLSAALPRERLKPARPDSSSVGDAVYGVKSAAMNLLRYGTNLIPAWSIGRFVGAPDLGAFNRATTMLTLPIEAVQRAFSYSLFPELRPGGPGIQSERALTDIMILVTWPAVVLGGLGYFAAPPLLAILLGPGWNAATDVAGLALLLGVVPIIGVPLASALEAQGRFRGPLVSWLLSSTALVLGAVGAARTSTLTPAMLGLLGAAVVTAAVPAAVLSNSRHLDLVGVVGHTWQVLAAQAVISVVLFTATQRFLASGVSQLLAVGLVGLAEVGLIWAMRWRTPWGRVATRYHLPGFGAPTA